MPVKFCFRKLSRYVGIRDLALLMTDELVPFGAIVKAKNGAYANACEKAKCDRLVGTRYTITTEDYIVYKKVKAEISGYPATLAGVEVIPAQAPAATKVDVR